MIANQQAVRTAMRTRRRIVMSTPGRRPAQR